MLDQGNLDYAFDTALVFWLEEAIENNKEHAGALKRWQHQYDNFYELEDEGQEVDLLVKKLIDLRAEYTTKVARMIEAHLIKGKDDPMAMTLDEARNIVLRDENHATLTYDLAEAVLKKHGEHRLAYFASRLAEEQRAIDALTGAFKSIREQAKPRQVTAMGNKDDILFVVDDHHGVYCPQVFCEKFEFEDFEGIEHEDWCTVLKGPNEEHYWEAWESILNNGTIVLDPSTMMFHGGQAGRHIQYYIYQEGGISLIPEGVSIDGNDETDDENEGDNNEE